MFKMVGNPHYCDSLPNLFELERRVHRVLMLQTWMFQTLPTKITKGRWTTRGPMLGLVAGVLHEEHDLQSLDNCLREARCTAPTEAAAWGLACHRTRHRATHPMATEFQSNRCERVGAGLSQATLVSVTPLCIVMQLERMLQKWFLR